MNKEIITEKVFKGFLKLVGIVVLIIPSLLLTTLVFRSIPAIRTYGLRFVFGQTWDPVREVYGALPFLTGTLITSFIALIIALPFSFSVALVLSEYMKEGIAKTVLKSAVELLAGIPSVIYGFWGLLVLVPLMRKLELAAGISPYGVSILAASIILAVMIIPYASTIAREVMSMVPEDIKEAAYSLGGTHWEVIRRVIIPTSRSGIFAGILLALGRALGETMAVTMVIGNTNKLSLNIFAPGNTMASVIANQFTEAVGSLYLSSLIELGLLLFVVTAIINFIGRLIMKRFEIKDTNK
jgi:phosphate transport system permease protein